VVERLAVRDDEVGAAVAEFVEGPGRDIRERLADARVEPADLVDRGAAARSSGA
jgi:hypothetical protein